MPPKLILGFGRHAVIACGFTIVLLSLMLSAAVFGYGQRFGQRCKAAGIRPDNKQWTECLARLAAAQSIPPANE